MSYSFKEIFVKKLLLLTMCLSFQISKPAAASAAVDPQVAAVAKKKFSESVVLCRESIEGAFSLWRSYEKSGAPVYEASRVIGGTNSGTVYRELGMKNEGMMVAVMIAFMQHGRQPTPEEITAVLAELKSKITVHAPDGLPDHIFQKLRSVSSKVVFLEDGTDKKDAN
jgi:hypothetical protein